MVWYLKTSFHIQQNPIYKFFNAFFQSWKCSQPRWWNKISNEKWLYDKKMFYASIIIKQSVATTLFLFDWCFGWQSSSKNGISVVLQHDKCSAQLNKKRLFNNCSFLCRSCPIAEFLTSGFILYYSAVTSFWLEL